MENPISKSLKVIFLIHMIVALILGAVLFAIPGRALTMLGWVPQQVEVQTQGIIVVAPGTSFVDPIITRLLAAALLAMAFASFMGWRAARGEQVGLYVQMELVFCVLGVVAILSNLLKFPNTLPLIAWVMAAILAAFAVAWGLALRR